MVSVGRPFLSSRSWGCNNHTVVLWGRERSKVRAQHSGRASENILINIFIRPHGPETAPLPIDFRQSTTRYQVIVKPGLQPRYFLLNTPHTTTEVELLAWRDFCVYSIERCNVCIAPGPRPLRGPAEGSLWPPLPDTGQCHVNERVPETLGLAMAYTPNPPHCIARVRVCVHMRGQNLCFALGPIMCMFRWKLMLCKPVAVHTLCH